MRLFLYKFLYLLLFLLLFSSNIYNQAKSNDNSFGDEYKTNVTKNYVSSLGGFNTSKARKNLETSVLPRLINIEQELGYPKIGSNKEIIEDGEKIGKHQSSSGIILRAEIEKNNYNFDEYKLIFEIYKHGQVGVFRRHETDYMQSGVGKFELKDLRSGNYYWKVRIKSDSGVLGNYIDYEKNGDYENDIDFSLFEGFEPYPYGYSFHNNSVADGLLTGSSSSSPNGWKGYFDLSGYHRTYNIVEGNKWDIFRNTFDISSFSNNNRKMISAFKSVGLNKANVFQGGNCYGMAVSAAMQYSHSGFIKNNFPLFSEEILNGTIFHKINSPASTSDGSWDIYNDISEAIYSFQLSQQSIHHRKVSDKGTKSPNDILKELKDNPSNTYILLFWGEKKDGWFFTEGVGHAVVPYKVEGKKIYFWDNNIPYPNRGKYKGYEQYIEVIEDSKGKFSWKAPNYSWSSFDRISLVNINEIHNGGKKSAPIGYGEEDTAYSLSGSSDIYVSDSLGRISGFKRGKVFKEIPGVDVIIPLNANPNGETIENTFKQIYLPKKKDLTIKVSGKIKESYDLMIAGGNYYTELSGVETSPGQMDEFISTIDKLEIDFDDKKVGDYNILLENFQNPKFGTIYNQNTKVKKEAQEYSINWQGVLEGSIDSIILKTDTNNDGVFDKKEKSSGMSIRKPIKTSSKNSNAQIIKRFKEKITKYLEKKIIRREIKINSKVYKILVVKSGEEYIKKLEKKLASAIKKLKVRQEDIKEFVLLINKIILNREIHRNSAILETYQNQLDKQFKKYVKDLKKLVNKK